MDDGNVSEAWNDILEKEDAYFPKDVSREFFTKVASTRWMTYFLKDASAKTFLEAGCGLGRFGITLAIHGKDVTLMDCSDQSLKGAEALKEIAERYFGKIDVELVKDDLEYTKFEDNEFDVTFNEGVIEHWLKREQRVGIIKEMARVTKPGGMVSIRVVNNKNSLYNFLYLKTLKIDIPPHHRYNLKELKEEMADAGLELIHWDGTGINDPGDWVRNKPLAFIINIINSILWISPKFIREIFCPSIFCTGRVQK